MKVKTSLGTIIVSESKGVGREGKGVWIELHRPNTLMDMMIAFVEIDTTSDQPQLVTRVWGNGVEYDYTDRIEHKNVEEFFKEMRDE